MARTREIVLPWRQQPQRAVGIAPWASTPGAWAWTPAAGFAGFGAGELAPIVGTVHGGVTPGGMSSRTNGSTDAILAPWATRFQLGQIAYVFQVWLTTTATAFVAGSGGNGSGGNGLYVEQPLDLNTNQTGAAAPGKFRFSIRSHTGQDTRCAPTNAVLGTNKIHTIVIVPRSANSVSVWVDGAAVALSYSATNYTSDDPTLLPPHRFALLNFGYGGTGAPYYIWGNAGAHLLLAARLTTTAFDGAALSANPWSLFAPQVRRIPVYSAAPSAVPSITFVGAENITSNSAGYRVTLNYA